MKRVIALLTLFLLVMAVMIALGDDVKMRPTTVDPSADGRVEFHTDRNGNTTVLVSVHHLAPPTNLTPAKADYVVWIQRPGHEPDNMGVLKVNENQEGTLKATTPYKAFDVFVTAEDNVRSQSPSSMEVLRAIVKKD